MTDLQLEQRLRTWYREEVGFTEPAPMSLRDDITDIPITYGPAALESRRRLILLAVAAMLTVAGIGTAIAIGSGLIDPPTPFPAPPQPVDAENGVIGFVALVTEGNFGVGRVSLVRADGTGLERLSGPMVSGKISWSPDGARFVYAATRITGDSAFQDGIHIANADGSEDRRVPGGADGMGPAWSPDGTSIAFSQPSADGGLDLFVMDVDGGDLRQLTDSPGVDLYPAWSPDSTQIVFMREVSGPVPSGGHQDDIPFEDGLFSIGIDGTSLEPVTDGTMIASQPAWSPDGTRIAFAARPYPESGSPSSYNPPWDVWIMNADGSAPERLTPGEASELNPVWSPDGTLIAYGSNEGPRAGVYVMEPDGSNPRVVILTDEGGVPPWPSWAGPASDR